MTTTTAQSEMNTSTLVLPEFKKQTRVQPLYNVILLDDDDHTYEYVIGMLRKLFGYSPEKSYVLASAVDNDGRMIIDTTTMERAEFKRDQIHGFGRDWRIARCAGSMSASIEPCK